MAGLPNEFSFRQLATQDLPDVLQLIKRHNHDDYECAQESYARSLNGQFVLTRSSRVAGVTGARKIPGSDRSFWLSWTYLDPSAAMNLKNPEIMFELLAEQLKERANARILFAMISPTVDSGLGGGHSYGGALDSYVGAGFQTECTHQDYYDAGESMTVLSLRLETDVQPQHVPEDFRQIEILDSDEIAETDDAYYFEWNLVDSPENPNSVSDWIENVRQWEGRVVFVGLPANARGAIEGLLSHGFSNDGILKNFYADGLDEVRLRFDV